MTIRTMKKAFTAVCAGLLLLLPLPVYASGTQSGDPENAGKACILFTSDVHCGVDQGFGYAGLKQVRDTLEAQGYETILVDDGDSVQGEVIGTLSKGESIIQLMNSLQYDAAIPGNHEFDYGMEQFLKLADEAEFPYISCNFTKEDKLVFEPYVIKEAAGMKIAFVGMTTPRTIIMSTPAYFQDENGQFIYGFTADDSGEAFYKAVQDAVDAARAEGADYVYAIGHLGNEAECRPWTYADVIEHTNGIDVFLDGHSHDTDQIVMKNKDGEDVVRSAVGTKMHCIGYSFISAEEGIEETNIWSWPNDKSAPELLGIRNEMSEAIAEEMEAADKFLEQKAGTSEFDLTISDPEEKDASGNPIRMVRRAETNMGDFCTDAIRNVLDADIGILNSGGIRADIAKGDISYKDLLDVMPFSNSIGVVKVKGQAILDALEWGARSVPEETGSFLQVSGITFEIDSSVESSCTSDSNGMFTGVAGERRVKNVKVGGKAIDPAGTYTVASLTYVLFDHGDGFTSFDNAEVISKDASQDIQAVVDYLNNELGGTIGEEYGDPYGQGRITILE